ncbi:CD63 antigen-like isoform X1 [Tigriopus californicus]|uniref:CD63 antigen-like isoform X1 n=2 Tax=Tigriopus californicus TaxID=6832 RepID=UPI0027DA8029|nr:CD63 antigen-like isoform X1 [Tigriopus californicus]XP_059090713.1 CD63 antigen-like isoform X1 [Tigriopus californicus]
MEEYHYSYEIPSETNKLVNNERCVNPCVKLFLMLINLGMFVLGVILCFSQVIGLAWPTLGGHALPLWVSTSTFVFSTFGLSVLGIMLLLVSFLGVAGLVMKSRALIFGYAALLLLCVFVGVGLAVVTWIKLPNIESEISEKLQLTFKSRYGVHNQTTEMVDALQSSLKCCGVKAFKDWEESAWFDLPDRNDLTVPDSCCIEPSDDCGKNVETNISFNGCEGTILALAWHELLIFAVLALVTFVLQMVACLISCCIKFHDPLYD